MRKKLQIFVSSTFTDLQEERQAAVEAVLKAGHIPAGMELFRSGDESQKETITKWIKESDAYLLILGGRYGSIEPTSGKSYTHWEYDFAGEIGIPRFAVVISDESLDKKVRAQGGEVLEKENSALYQDFKKDVLNKTSQFFNDTKDIQLTIMQKLSELTLDDSLKGWISGKNLQDAFEVNTSLLKVTNENTKLKDEIARLREIIDSQEKQVKPSNLSDFDSMDFEERASNILRLLNANFIRKGTLDFLTEGQNGMESIRIPLPGRPFDSYNFRDAEGFVNKLLIVAFEDDNTNLAPLLSEIRFLIREYKHTNVIPIKFVVGIPGNHGQLQDELDIFLENAIKIEKIDDDVFFEIQVWDSNVLNKFEVDLGLNHKITNSPVE